MDNKNTIIKYALANALWTVMYIILVATFFNSAQAIFGQVENKILIPVIMLLLFVFSATVCGSLVLGRPLLLYLDGEKKKALTLFAYTVGVLFIVMIMMMIVLYALK
ncbi:MAG: hypothetical protein AAB470_00055 [Patescibacteria group bacterium]